MTRSKGERGGAGKDKAGEVTVLIKAQNWPHPSPTHRACRGSGVSSCSSRRPSGPCHSPNFISAQLLASDPGV